VSVVVCRFSACDDTPVPKSYAALKERALAVGRFSVFEATTSRAAWFTRLCRDPEVETYDMGFPWTGVRKRTAPP
jgi:hypothetical protein